MPPVIKLYYIFKNTNVVSWCNTFQRALKMNIGSHQQTFAFFQLLILFFVSRKCFWQIRTWMTFDAGLLLFSWVISAVISSFSTYQLFLWFHKSTFNIILPCKNQTARVDVHVSLYLCRLRDVGAWRLSLSAWQAFMGEGFNQPAGRKSQHVIDKCFTHASIKTPWTSFSAEVLLLRRLLSFVASE